MEEIVELLFAIQGFIIIAFIVQFISNMVIIFQLPKIKRMCEEMCYEEEEEENT